MDGADWINLTQGQGISVRHSLHTFHLSVIYLGYY